MSRKHHKLDLKTFDKGINSDTNKELLASAQGFHVDALNMRSMPSDGDNSAKKKIKGEVIKYPNLNNRCSLSEPYLPLATTYECLATIEIAEHIIEIWASPNRNSNPPIIRVDGKIVLQSVDLPIYYNEPIQYHKNENCVGGEFYFTNKNFPPIVFSLKDLMLNSAMTYNGEVGDCTSKYFEDFNLEEYTINVSSNINKPKFVKQSSSNAGYDKVFGTVGIPIGSYSYSYRYATQDGDRTVFSPITELIAITRNISTQFVEHPYLRTYGGDPNLLSPTTYGNHIRLRYENTLNFDFIELRRDSWYGGDAIGTPPISEIVGSIDIGSGIGILNVLDKVGAGEAQEILSLSEVSSELNVIAGAKSIRYFNERLYIFNINYQSKDIDNNVDFVAGSDLIFPTIEKLGVVGHKHAYNTAMYKANMRGEKQSFAVILFDQSGNMSYAKKITGADNFEFPNRRDLVSSLTKGTSYKGLVTAASTTIGIVDETHEVFDNADAVEKSGDLKFNILDYALGAGDNTYNACHPTSQADTNDSGFRRPNSSVYKKKTFLSDFEIYSPDGFRLNYYSMGAAFKGIDTSSLPAWVSGFSVVQTEPAGRVVAQGLGYYDLISAGDGGGSNTEKQLESIVVYFPDLDENTGINPAIIDELLDPTIASTGYELQVVCPLGFFTEVYDFLNAALATPDSQKRGVDMITYCRILYENGQINPTDTGGTVGNGGYVDFGTWREGSQNTYFNTFGGNVTFPINSITEITTESTDGKYFKITLDELIYTKSAIGANQESEDADVKEFHEPVYAVNIIKKGAAIADDITTQYKYGGNFTKIKSLIGISSGIPISLPLVSERREDCIQSLSGEVNNDYAALERFVFIKDTIGVERRWLNVTEKTNGDIVTILTDITNNGFFVATDTSGSYNVYGVYKSTEAVEDLSPLFTLVFEDLALGAFSVSIQVPPIGNEIYVRYDNRIPVRVFGGDTFINESVWAVKDNVYDSSGDPETGSDFRLNVPFPYQGYELSNDIRIVRDTQGLDKIQSEKSFSFDPDGVSPARIRQLIALWTAETRINLSYSFNDEITLANIDQFFPLKNYIPRPHKWNPGSEDDAPTFIANNNLHSDYFDDYGYEWNFWRTGGFRFRPQTNIDYSKKQNNLLITSVPTIGFIEQKEYCTRISGSVKRPINVQNTPTVRTFPAENIFDISDDTGEIKFAWSAMSSDKGNNLYAFTDSGVCLLLIDKRIIHEINANELATVGSDVGGILNQLWIDRTIGMSDETWRSWAEYSNMLFFCNKTSVFMFSDNQLTDLAQTGFEEMFTQRIAPYIKDGYESKLSGVFNLKHKEYILTFDKSDINILEPCYGLIPKTIIYGLKQNALQCRSDYVYDKYLQIQNRLYGMKDLITYELGIGNLLSTKNIVCNLVGLSDAEILWDKEFIRIRVNSNSKPEKIIFYNSYKDYINGVDSSLVDSASIPLSIKNYHGYECYIPRGSVAPYFRQQGRVVLFQIISSADEEFLVSSVGVQYKNLK